MCFAASYLVAFGIDAARGLLRYRIRPVWIWLWCAVGLIAHTSYLVMRAKDGLENRGVPLSNWYHWCLIAAWAVAFVYLFLSLQRASSSIGLFLMPIVLGLIFVASLFPREQFFSTRQAAQVWGTVHGIGLLLGTVCVLIGFATGIMYLLQERRLKKKLPTTGRIKLPSLEWLGHANERMLYWSAGLLGGGVLAGVVLNLVRGVEQTSVPWLDTTVLVSGFMLIWLVATSVFSVAYKPVRVGRKVAYLTVANFVILAMTLTIVLSSQHANDPAADTRTTTALENRVAEASR